MDCRLLLNDKDDAGNYTYWASSKELRSQEMAHSAVKKLYVVKFIEEQRIRPEQMINFENRCREEILHLEELNKQSWTSLFVGSSSGFCLSTLKEHCASWIPQIRETWRTSKEHSQSTRFLAGAGKVCGGWCQWAKSLTVKPRSLASMASNKFCTGTWLTSSKTIDAMLAELKVKNLMNDDVRYFGGLGQHTFEQVQNRIGQKRGKATYFAHMVHIQSKSGYVEHSSLLVVGRNKNGPYGMYIDPQGNQPSQTRITDQSLYIDKVDTSKFTVQSVYNHFVEKEEIPAPLMFSGESLQADAVSCTAYTATFMKKVAERIAEERLEDFQPENLMQEFADDRLISFAEVREIVK